MQRPKKLGQGGNLIDHNVAQQDVHYCKLSATLGSMVQNEITARSASTGYCLNESLISVAHLSGKARMQRCESTVCFVAVSGRGLN